MDLVFLVDTSSSIRKVISTINSVLMSIHELQYDTSNRKRKKSQSFVQFAVKINEISIELEIYKNQYCLDLAN